MNTPRKIVSQITVFLSPAQSESRDVVMMCDGNDAVSCYMGVLNRRDCGAQGGSCVAEDWGAYCVTACTSDGSWCEGTERVNCSFGELDRWDCPDGYLQNPSCVISQDGYATCVSTPATACDWETFSSYCDGNAAVRCGFGGYLSRYNCGNSWAAWASQCTVDAEGAFCRIPETVPCNLETAIACA